VEEVSLKVWDPYLILGPEVKFFLLRYKDLLLGQRIQVKIPESWEKISTSNGLSFAYGRDLHPNRSAQFLSELE
jgi:hypothetical protein